MGGNKEHNYTTFNDFLKVKINEAISVISISFHNIAIKRHTIIEKIGHLSLSMGELVKKNSKEFK